MDIATLTDFFMWCSIINGALLLYTVALFILLPDRVYSIQNKLFPLERERFNAIYYAFVGGYKVLFLIFNVVPYIALRIIA
ncbi:MAG: hypothetical protein OCC46_16100 [Pseudodesulfovibrio sp.]